MTGKNRLLQRRRVLSFELTNDWWAWFIDDDEDFFCQKVDAIGLARVWILRGLEEEYSHEELVGIVVTSDGTEIVDECDNFAGLFRTGVVPWS